jgi:hypothetical protein
MKGTVQPVRAKPAVDAPAAAEVAELALVLGAVLQGVCVGGWLALFPAMALSAGGFPPAPPFFVRWAGVLHLILAAGYALEWLRFRRVTLLILAKGATAFFLALAWAGEGVPWLMVFATILEGGMAIAGALLQGPASKSRRARATLRLVTPMPHEVRPAGRR